MIKDILLVLVIWFISTIPVGLLVGRLFRHANTTNYPGPTAPDGKLRSTRQPIISADEPGYVYLSRPPDD
jgi:hypothetical protein